jgi:hypothetical protein
MLGNDRPYAEVAGAAAPVAVGRRRSTRPKGVKRRDR